MATVTHYIRSYYNPEDRVLLEQETGQRSSSEQDLDPEEAWQREAARISHRQRLQPPQFIAATISSDEWTSSHAGPSRISEDQSSPLGTHLSRWYRTLTNSESAAMGTSGSDHQDAQTATQSLVASTSPVPPGHADAPITQPAERRNKNNWFIMKAIHSEPSSSISIPAPNLADILSRDPPPLPSQGRYTPPVWLEIGPSNKGFGMLQRSGWNEGEPLGPDVVRKTPFMDILINNDILPTDRKEKMKYPAEIPAMATQKVRMEVKMEKFDGVSELRNVELIDLTLSDPDVDSDDLGRWEDEDSAVKEEDPTQVTHVHPQTPLDHGRKALLTPIATVLKSDRLGIGLKAKTTGPHKASQKRVTHNAAALATHTKAAEESRRRMTLFGRGRRGFEKQRKREEESRKAMLAYLKN